MLTRFVLKKKKSKGKNLTSLGINTPVYINDSLCIYYKKLWAKCKKLHNNKLCFLDIEWFHKTKSF